jgi:hypothetical protein
MPNIQFICSCSNELIENIPCQIKACDITNYGSTTSQIKCNSKQKQLNTQKQIQNQVRVAESQLIDVRSAVYSGFDFFQAKYNKTFIAGSQNMSDRVVPHIQRGFIGRRGSHKGNSVRHSITSSKPGSTGPGGIGVDVKHGSYARYLAKLKTPYLVNSESAEPIRGNKSRNLSLLGKNCNLCCK